MACVEYSGGLMPPEPTPRPPVRYSLSCVRFILRAQRLLHRWKLAGGPVGA